MARVTPPLGHSTPRGSIGGVTYGSSIGGAVLKLRGITPTSRFGLQQLVRARLGTAAQAFRALTDYDRRRWQAAAEQLPELGADGNLYRPSAFELFVSCACHTLEVFGTLPPAPPSPIRLEQPTVAVTTASIGTATLTVVTGGGVPAGGRRVIAATRAFPNGIYNTSRVPFRTIATNVGGGTANRFGVYATQWPTPTAARIGEAVIWRTYIVSANGLASPPTDVRFVWAA